MRYTIICLTGALLILAGAYLQKPCSVNPPSLMIGGWLVAGCAP